MKKHWRKYWQVQNDGSLVYKPGQGPINVKVYTPIEVVDGNYTLEMKDRDLTDDILDVNAKWQLKREGDAGIILSDTTLQSLNEQVIAKYGFSIAIAQVKDAGKEPKVDNTNGAIGSTVQYKNSGTPWLTAVPDDAALYQFLPDFLNYLKNQVDEPDFDLDTKQALGKTNPNYLFVPYSLADYRDVTNVPFLTPAWLNSSSSGL